MDRIIFQASDKALMNSCTSIAALGRSMVSHEFLRRGDAWHGGSSTTLVLSNEIVTFSFLTAVCENSAEVVTSRGWSI